MQEPNKLTRIPEKSQIKWGILLFKTFLLFAGQRNTISSSQLQTLQKELEELSQAAIGEDLPESIVDQLNHYISMFNEQMKQNTKPTKYAPFPTFSFAEKGHIQSAVLDQLDMVERTLTEASEAQVIDLDKESLYFAKILDLFSKVENEKIQPKEAITKLINEIEEINTILPENNKLPLPELEAYE